MGTYERCFKHVKPTKENGHALRNIDNIKSMKKAKKEIEEMIKCQKLNS